MENGAAGGTERSCLSAVLEIFPAKGPGALRNGGICFEHEQRKADEACRARPKRTESYQWNRGLDVPDEENYKIDYLLVKGSKASPEDVIAYASFEDDMVRFHPLRENDQPFAHYGECFTYDSDLFEPLEQGYSLACMSPEAHACAWYEIEDLQGGIEHQAGMQSYLHYCKQHGVTRVQLARLADYDGMDVMKLYDRQAVRGAQGKQKKEFER